MCCALCNLPCTTCSCQVVDHCRHSFWIHHGPRVRALLFFLNLMFLVLLFLVLLLHILRSRKPRGHGGLGHKLPTRRGVLAPFAVRTSSGKPTGAFVLTKSSILSSPPHLCTRHYTTVYAKQMRVKLCFQNDELPLLRSRGRVFASFN